MDIGAVGVSPYQRRDRTLAGFVLSNRWPASTREWAQFLALAVRLAALPGLVPTTEVFRAVEDLPDDPEPGTIGLVTCEGPVIGIGSPRPGQFGDPLPPALLVLHPPAETRPSTPEVEGAASGVVLLPGMPHLGLEHRAAWVEAEPDGTVTRLVSRVGVQPMEDPDLAVLAAFLAA
jgi:hypothetical protein